MLDPTNLGRDFLIQPLLQAAICRYNPFAGGWRTRFRGFIESAEYEFDPSQQVNRLTLELVDIFEILSAIEMHPGHFGDIPPKASKGQVYYNATTPTSHNGMKIRCDQILHDCDPTDALSGYFAVTFSGNVSLRATVYSPGESAMTAIQDAADAEFPNVSNVYGDRMGRVAVHGRYARFDPEGTAGTVDPSVWDFQDFKAGDHAAVEASPDDTAHVRGFSFSRDVNKVINRALCTPFGIADSKVDDQVVSASGSIDDYGLRPWSVQDLIVARGITEDNSALEECKLYAQYHIDSYKQPHNRVSSITFRSSSLDAEGSAANWKLLARCDIADRVALTLGSPGGGGFEDALFFVEGVHEEVLPLRPLHDDVTLTLDLSPAAYFDDNPFAAAP